MELLVATAILVMVMALLLNVVAHIGKIWQHAESQKNRRQLARIALDMIARDFGAAAFPLDQANQQSLHFVLNPAELDASFFNRDAAFWQTAAASDTAAGDLCQTGYFVKWTTDAGAPAAELRRFYLPANHPASIFLNPAGWISPEILNTHAPGSDAGNLLSEKGLVARNVLALWITLFDRDGETAGLGPSYDSRAAVVRPASVEIALAIADSIAADRIAASSTVTDLYGSASIEDLAETLNNRLGGGVQVFKTRVPIEAAERMP